MQVLGLLAATIEKNVLPLPKSGGGECMPRQGNADADASFLTQGQPPLVSRSIVTASTTRRVGIALTRPYASYSASASMGISERDGADQGLWNEL